ncbi:MAG: GGDEF and EAL domain-containing protein [Gammaproteobacteria bacterium]|nr:GGDEF and EAL domain-containing protein [Gammaproteobacteria bacterium]
MISPSIPADETSRLFALYSLRILGTDPEPAYDNIAALARKIYKVPFAGISFVDQNEVWLKTTDTSGLAVAPRARSFCGHGVLSDAATIVNDTAVDERFVDHPGVTEAQLNGDGIRAYCGVPVHAPTGHRVGMLCLLDIVPRNFTDAELEPLKLMAATVEDLLTHHNHVMRACYLDSLTGLPINLALTDQISLALARVDNHSSLQNVFLLSINIDNFRFVNSRGGRPAGDKLIRVIAQRLRPLISDTCMLFKEPGDNFYIVCQGIPDVSVAALADDIKNKIAMPFAESDEAIELTASIGITKSRPGLSADDLVNMADIALQEAKKRGRDAVSWYEEPADDSDLQQFEIYSDLKKALLNNELELFYQPTIKVDSGQILAMEALLRWNHPRLGLMHPADFLDLAETTGLIVSIGEWVVQEACIRAQSWHTSGLKEFVMSVNMSAVQFERGDLCQVIDKALQLSGLPAQYLELELTESILVSENDTTREIIKDLKQMGVRLAIDDFGTGYSNLSYLRKIAFDKIKIDQSFIRLMGEDEESFVVVKAIKQLADSLGIEVVAEGVETESELEILRQVGISAVQGYLLARPSPCRHQINADDSNTSVDSAIAHSRHAIASSTK